MLYDPTYMRYLGGTNPGDGKNDGARAGGLVFDGDRGAVWEDAEVPWLVAGTAECHGTARLKMQRW